MSPAEKDQMSAKVANAIAAVLAETQYSPVMDEPSPPPAPPAELKRGRPPTREIAYPSRESRQYNVNATLSNPLMFCLL
eukprot:SAG31_NODE_2927_length_4900_cov_42.568314_2_plen_79_part_00